MQLCTDCIKSSTAAVIFSQALKACPNSKKKKKKNTNPQTLFFFYFRLFKKTNKQTTRT